MKMSHETHMEMSEYDRTLSELFVRFPSVQNAGFSTSAYKPGLEHMEEFDRLMGRPSRAVKTIHVAGTNGKGSVASMITSGLSVGGRKVGLYTSPHILDFRERIRMVSSEGVEMISEDEVLEFVHRWSADFDRLSLSFFEITTGMAFWWFAAHGADYSVIEVGLGGRLDSTNIITPVLSAVTSIGLDHCALLGNTRSEIAFEKAGIFKPGVPAVVGVYDEETAPVFEKVASQVGCPVIYASEMVMPSDFEEILGGMDLRGEYQRVNLKTALVALQMILSGTEQASTRSALMNTAARTGFHGRWERIGVRPDIICDIGHNPPALKWNFAQLEKMVASGQARRLIIIYGVMADKALDDIIPLMPHDADWIFTTPSTPRAMPSSAILARCKEAASGPDAGRMQATASVREALSLALSIAEPGDMIYIGGSTFVVADALKNADLLKRPAESSKKESENLQIQK